MKKAIAPLGAALVLAVAAGRADAFEPVALVEAASGVDGVYEMDFLEAGHRIDLSAGASLTLSYLESCRIEVIDGGIVTVGTTESAVEGGQVAVDSVPCASQAGEPEQKEAGALAFRNAAPTQAVEADITLTSVYPVLKSLSGDPAVTLTRLDQAGFEEEVALDAGIADLKESRLRLERGGVYRLTHAGGTVSIYIDPQAKSQQQALISRLVVF